MESFPIIKPITKKKGRTKLTPKRQDFVNAYVETKVAARAAQIAYNLDPDNKQLAASMGSEVLRNPDVRQEIDRRFQEVQDYYQENALRAAEIVKELAEKAETETVKLGAAKDIQDRAGHMPLQKSLNVSHKSIKLDL